MDYLETMTKEELIKLILAYDKYVIEITNREDGSCPACLMEFYNNDYQLAN